MGRVVRRKGDCDYSYYRGFLCARWGLSGKTTGKPLTLSVPVAFLTAKSKPSGNWLYLLSLCKHPGALFKPIRKQEISLGEGVVEEKHGGLQQ